MRGEIVQQIEDTMGTPGAEAILPMPAGHAAVVQPVRKQIDYKAVAVTGL